MQLGGRLLQEAPQALRADLILCSHTNLSSFPCQGLGDMRAAAVSLSLSALEPGAQETCSQCLWSEHAGRGRGVLSLRRKLPEQSLAGEGSFVNQNAPPGPWSQGGGGVGQRVPRSPVSGDRRSL